MCHIRKFLSLVFCAALLEPAVASAVTLPSDVVPGSYAVTVSGGLPFDGRRFTRLAMYSFQGTPCSNSQTCVIANSGNTCMSTGFCNGGLAREDFWIWYNNDS